MTPIATPPGIHAVMKSLPLGWAGTCDLLLTEADQCHSHGYATLLALSLPIPSHPGFHDVNCHMEKPTWQVTEGGLQPIARKELGLLVHQPTKN